MNGTRIERMKQIFTDLYNVFVGICQILDLRVLFFPFVKNLSFEFRFGTKVQQQTDLSIGCLEIVYQLGFMCFSNFFGNFQLQDNLVINKDVSKILTNCFPFIKDLNGDLLLDSVSTFR